MINFSLLPLLGIQRSLYDLPRGMERFQRYLDVMRGGSNDIALPLPVFNPMGKPHVTATLDALIALDAEAIAMRAIAQALPRLTAASGEFQLAIVVVDDLGGGWTNRSYTEITNQFQQRALLKRGWALALLWTSETPTAERVHIAALATIFRTAYVQAHGLPTTLRAMMRQEGLAAVFAGAGEPALDGEELAYTSGVIEPFLDATDIPAIFSCLYGDAAAQSVGYTPLGLSPRAGYVLAHSQALACGMPPELAAALAADPLTRRTEPRPVSAL